ncbi:unnamed protein product, partial [Polarella glacialis]
VQGLMSDKLDGLRFEWKAALDEERERASDRVQAMGRALTREFEQSVVSQATAEARALMNLELDSRLKDFSHGLSGLGRELEVLRSRGQGQACTEGQQVHNRLKSLEDALTDRATADGESVENRCVAISHRLGRVAGDAKVQAEKLDTLQQQFQVLSDSLRTKLQALIHKVDGKCMEGLLPILEGIGAALKEMPSLKPGSLDKTSSSCWADTTLGSGISAPNLVSTGPQVLAATDNVEAIIRENRRLREEILGMKHSASQSKDFVPGRSMHLPVGPGGSASPASPPREISFSAGGRSPCFSSARQSLPQGMARQANPSSGSFCASPTCAPRLGYSASSPVPF